MDPLLLRPADVARVLDIGLTKVYELIGDGTLPVIRLGRRGVRVPADALRAFVERHTIPARGTSRPARRTA